MSSNQANSDDLDAFPFNISPDIFESHPSESNNPDLPELELPEADKAKLRSRSFVVGRPLSRGQFGAVFRATFQEKPCVVKTIVHLEFNFFELSIIKRLKHRNIVKLYDFYLSTRAELLVFMELAGGGSLTDRLNKEGTWLGEKEVARYYRQFGDAFRYMHAAGIAHLDIHPGNILLMDQTKRHHCKVTDFGLSKLAFHPHTGELLYFKEHTQALFYAPPEMLWAKLSPDYFYPLLPVDVWSTGVLLYELLNNSLPFDLAHPDVLQHMLNSWYHIQNQDLSQGARELISMHFVPDPLGRSSFEDILRNADWLRTAALDDQD